MLIFCCHKCHTRRKIRRKNSSKFSQDTEKSRKKGHKTRILRCIFKLISAGQPPHLLKRIHNYTVTNRISTPYLQPCDTCDSKNTKTPVTRAYAYAREGVIICIFTIPQTQFLSSVSPIVFLRFPSCIKNEPSLSIKRHVVFTKTSRRFHQNNTSLFRTQHFDFGKKKLPIQNVQHKKVQKASLHLEQRKESCKFVAELRTRTDLTACNLKKKMLKR